jgi:hypothetical protein
MRTPNPRTNEKATPARRRVAQAATDDVAPVQFTTTTRWILASLFHCKRRK